MQMLNMKHYTQRAGIGVIGVRKKKHLKDEFLFKK